MALLLLLPPERAARVKTYLLLLDSQLDIRTWPDPGERSDVTFAVVWGQPEGELARYPNLQAVSSFGAGVDHLLNDPALPPHLPICRVIDSELADEMFEFLHLLVLDWKRGFSEFAVQQHERRWRPRAPREVESIGILGLGELGGAVADAFVQQGFSVSGWSRNFKNVEGVRSYAGENGLIGIADEADCLICLLPLTPRTRGVLNRSVFQTMHEDSLLVNVGRGAHIVEHDLIAALDSGRPARAVLDVFETEPLPRSHPFWTHPRIIVTPHVASLTDPASVAPQILENYRNVLAGEPLQHMIDREKGY